MIMIGKILSEVESIAQTLSATRWHVWNNPFLRHETEFQSILNAASYLAPAQERSESFTELMKCGISHFQSDQTESVYW